MASESTQSAANADGQPSLDVVAACGLSAVPALGASSLSRIARSFGSLKKAVEEGPRAILGRSDALKLRRDAVAYLARGPDLEELGLWALGAASAAGARVVLLADDDYPRLLREIRSPPQLLYVRGSLPAEARRVAVVGSRHAGEEGLEIAGEFGEALACAGVTVVSGGARGVDTAAHHGASSGSGASIAVLGCGIDVVYPPENGELFEGIARSGAVVSEFAPGTQPLPPNFPRRNSTIAGLSDAVVVVRAALQSGALITANHAARAKRRVFAVPGDASDPTAQGSNELLQMPAVLRATCAVDVLQALGWPVPEALLQQRRNDAHRQRGSPPAGQERAAPDEEPLDEGSLGLWQLLDERTPTHVDDLASRAQLPAGETLRRLADLELKGRCVQRPGKYFLRR